MNFDPRITPAKANVAASHLKGKVKADRYVEGRERMIATSSAPVTALPEPEAALTSQLLYGEIFTVYDVDAATGLAWGQAKRDGYVGWVPNFMLEPIEVPTHHVSALITHLYAEPNLKSRPYDMLPMLSEIAVVGQEGPWMELSRGGWVHGRHVRDGMAQEDWVTIAEKFIFTPYLWGGRTASGIDCSGLVQIALQAAGLTCPRDSDMQFAELGQDVDIRSNLQRGDLVFWNGHVGILTAPDTLLHANAYAMATVYEPFRFACDRIKAQGDGDVTGIRRL